MIYALNQFRLYDVYENNYKAIYVCGKQQKSKMHVHDIQAICAKEKRIKPSLVICICEFRNCGVCAAGDKYS